MIMTFEASYLTRSWEGTINIRHRSNRCIIAIVSALGSRMTVCIVQYYPGEYGVFLPEADAGCCIGDYFDAIYERLEAVESNRVDRTSLARAIEMLLPLFKQ